jgi:hypothetical protein
MTAGRLWSDHDMNLHPTLTNAVIEDAARRSMFGCDNPGFCIECGAEVDGVEPDARGYTCDECGAAAVYGACELLGEGHDTLTAPADDEPAASQPRPLWKIARDIRANWPRVNYAAVPYLDAMAHLSTMRDMYGCDPAAHIVGYFLSNARSWRGDDARRIKAELKALL